MKQTNIIMKNLLLKALTLITLFIGIATINNTQAQSKKWEQLGSKEVNFGLDKDEILVTASEGIFKSVMLKVKKAPINMYKMTLVFGDGSEQNVELKNNFRAGSQSRIIDLEGNNRVIRKVVLLYDTKNYKRRKATVELWGKH